MELSDVPNANFLKLNEAVLCLGGHFKVVPMMARICNDIFSSHVCIIV